VTKGRLHFVGIGGIGMSALAQILLARGVTVSGSDVQESAMTRRLADLGAEVAIGHRAELVEGADRVIMSDAIRPDNPEVVRAREAGIRLQRRSELLAELMAGHRGIAVSGTHGKTTVTAMIAAILSAAGMDPTVALGGEHGALGGNARAGGGEWFVVEACEAYDSFLDLRPELAVVTNIEPEHLDHHGTEAHLRASFGQFLSRVGPGGCAVLCADRAELRQAAEGLRSEVIWYGRSDDAHVRGTEVEADGSGGRCHLWIDGEEVGELRVGLPGVHNVVNALGATTAAWRAGARPEDCRRALAGFAGVARRFEVLGEPHGITVVDDYAHHPTEIAATMEAARSAFPGRRIVAVFQPHLYSRTRDFAEGFAAALSKADLVVLTDIYPAREAPLPGVTASLIAGPLRKVRREDLVWEMTKEEVKTKLAVALRSGDVVLVMGAGDIGQAARDLARRLGAVGVGGQSGAAKR
jgi:UDP-N-acetylmuramate--alanine ligase